MQKSLPSQIDPTRYQQSLDHKVADLRKLFKDLPLGHIEVFPSSPGAYRMRAEFKIWQSKGRADYAMYRPGAYKKPYTIDEFAPGSTTIQDLMPKLLKEINSCEILRRRLFGVEFLSGLSGDALITLLYHRPLDHNWENRARAASDTLNTDIIGRSRKQKIQTGRDHIVEQLTVAGRDYKYQQIETGFTQPNAVINQVMLEWALIQSRELGGDLLELYCGNGNFTVVLAQNFRRVLATEISKLSVRAAEYNFSANRIQNVAIARLSAQELTDALNGVRPFRRLRNIDLSDYDFSTAFVDPPRAGIDRTTLELLSGFDNILYISCNPRTLYENLLTLGKSHQIQAFAVFDQFPYTEHLECGVLLKRSA